MFLGVNFILLACEEQKASTAHQDLPEPNLTGNCAQDQDYGQDQLCDLTFLKCYDIACQNTPECRLFN